MHTSPENEHRSDIRELNTTSVMWSTYVPIRDPRPTIPKQELNLSITSTHNIRRRFGAANNNMRVTQAMPLSRHWANVARSESFNIVLSDGVRPTVWRVEADLALPLLEMRHVWSRLSLHSLISRSSLPVLWNKHGNFTCLMLSMSSSRIRRVEWSSPLHFVGTNWLGSKAIRWPTTYKK